MIVTGWSVRCQFVLLTLVVCASCVRAPDTSGQSKSGAPVRMRGILTYFDQSSRDCFVQDSTSGIRVKLAPGQVPPAIGWRVEVSGLGRLQGAVPTVLEAHITALVPDKLPAPIPISSKYLRDPEYAHKIVSVKGVIQAVDSERPGLVSLDIGVEGTTVIASVPASFAMINEDWIDAEVRASGVLAEGFDGNGRAMHPALLISDAGSIEVLSQSRAPAALASSKIADLLAVNPARCEGHRTRIKGVLYTPAQGGLALRDASGQIPIRMARNAVIPNAGVIDLAGFPTLVEGHPVLARAVPVEVEASKERLHAPAPGSILTTIRQVHRLPTGVAQLAYPVHLRAVVTFFDPHNQLLFIQDRSDGIYVGTGDQERLPLRAGDDVDVTGVTTGDFAPDVAKARVRVLGHSGLPAPGPGNFRSAVQGGEDCHWIELDGVVQQVVRGDGDTLLTLVWGRERFKAHVLASPQSLESLVDAEVRIRGVCGALFNGRRQQLGIQMFVPEMECIRVLRKPASNPFWLPLTPVGGLLHFSLGGDMGHQVRVRGTVTYGNRAGATWLRDSTGGVMIQDHGAERLAAGDLVDAVAFPAIVESSPVLRGAKVRKLRSGSAPEPIRTTAQDLLKGDLDAQLVQIEGKLVERAHQMAEQVLTLDSGGTIFNAILPQRDISPPLEPGALLRLTGICSVGMEQTSDLILPRDFRLLLRSPADIAVLSHPPWLTANHVIPLLAGAALLFLAAAAWAALLRRRVRAQTHALRAQTVQLQAAHQKTREALQKACEAEALDQDSKRIVELIARDEPVDLIIDHIAEAVALHLEGAAVCAILLAERDGRRVCTVPSMPADWLQALRRIEISSISFCSSFREPKDFSDDPAWAQFIGGQPSARYRTFWSAPIVVDSATVGVIAAFFRNDKRSPDAPGASLDLWSNVAALALERRRLHDQLSYRAHHDELTGLPNRALLYERLEAEIEASRSGFLLGVLYIDLDGFKQINDTYGHDAGDAVLEQSARRMIHNVRSGDTVARMGGDEFVILLPRLGHREDAAQIAEKIAAAVREPIYAKHQKLAVSASVGISIWPLDADRPDPLLRFADAQMYGKKRRRRYDAPAKSPDREISLSRD